MDRRCIYINPDNVNRFLKYHPIKIAIICRPDHFIETTNCDHLIIETKEGVNTRCFLGVSQGIEFLIMYGRFGLLKKPAGEIDYKLNQETMNLLHIQIIIGTFCVGAIAEDKTGEVYLPDQIIGNGNFAQYFMGKHGFRNIEMYHPICPSLYQVVKATLYRLPFEVRTETTYVSTNGFPRFETKAEVQIFSQIRGDIVGQTMDTEATLARASGCHYVGIAATSDGQSIRERVATGDPTVGEEQQQLMVSIREKTFAVFLNAIREIS